MSLRIGARRASAALVLAVLGVGAFAGAAWAEGCPNEQLRGQDGYALALPDCRAYEQVSPVDKNFTDALGEADVVQSSPSGNGVTFFSDAPFPAVLSATGPSVYLSTLAGAKWSTQGLVPQTIPRSLPGHGSASVLSLTEELSEALVLVEPGLEAGTTPGRYTYLRNSDAGAFQLLGPGIARFAGATPGDSRILFESREQLLPEAASNVVNLYERNGNRPPGQELTLAGVLPDGKAPVGGTVAGPGGPALGGATGGATGEFYTQDTISEDGSRIFFSDAGTGWIYMREPEARRTIPVSAGTGPAYWRAATADGSEVFYTEGEDLYRFNVNKFEESKKPESEALADAREALTSGAAGVLGTLGISTKDGSRIYFIATSTLADNETDNQEKAEAGKANLYEWHAGEASFIARLSTDEYDEYDWRGFYSPNPGVAPATGEKSSRVTPDGKTVLFTSRSRLTSYDNAGQGVLYLYDATNGGLTCVSCDLSGVPATSSASLAGNLSIAAPPGRNSFLTRNLSEDGNRVFFQTKEALVPQDTNDQTDVYEWEGEGTGSCKHASASFSASSGGCLYLISTGQSGDQSYFGDASADGSNVFFFTREALVGQDQDDNDDLYDARVEGGITAQNPPPSASCTGEGCLAPVATAPVFGASSSASFSGSGNLLKPSPAKPKKVVARCPKRKMRRHGKCVKKRAKKAKKSKRASRNRKARR